MSGTPEMLRIAAIFICLKQVSYEMNTDMYDLSS
jgi:hypothetical protein